MIGFEAGLLRYVHLGKGTGMKALSRLLGLDRGTFGSRRPWSPTRPPSAAPAGGGAPRGGVSARRDRSDGPGALLAGGPRGGDGRRLGGRPRQARGRGARSRPPLASACSASSNVIPEPDKDIYQALVQLADAGEVEIES